MSNLPTLQLFITIKSIFQLYSIHILHYFQKMQNAPIPKSNFGGDLKVETKENEGTEFIIHLKTD